MIENVEFAFKLIEMEMREFIRENGFKPFTFRYKITDFENKKDYKLTLTLKEVRK